MPVLLTMISDRLPLRLEDKLILLCARTNVGAETRERIKSIAASPDKLASRTMRASLSLTPRWPLTLHLLTALMQ